ncbi:helix-turn-helix domain-containing protein [Leeia sp. TBRC 13508]|uniref:Helix-turn-helix domain-containing protein n=1 Tax=Leeia speluncae TaxID=2884804 RepID=A0ABS8DBZ1_9NEIS|nr:helix-turn-helix transcriptional regulator [Leeia speluncae]MCB6185163.1 helix-turn-helix domain-containing protein [Leeia speluncae]
MKRVVKIPFPSDLEILTPSHLGQAIKAARTQSGLTQEQAALFCGMSKQTYMGIEQGKDGTAIGSILEVAKHMGVALFVVPNHQRDKLKQQLSTLMVTSDET